MSPIVHCIVYPSRWAAPREITRQSRFCHSHDAQPHGGFTKVERIRSELAVGRYPLDAHLDAVIERLFSILSKSQPSQTTITGGMKP